MIISTNKFFYSILLLYFLFSTFSGYSNNVVQNIGTYGKIIILIVSIIISIVYHKNIIPLFSTKNYFLFFVFFVLIIFSGINSYFHSEQLKYMFLSFYIVLSYLFILLITIRIYEFDSFIKSLETIILIQFIIGFALIFILGLDIYDYSAGGVGEKTGGLSAFLEKRNTFSLLCAIGFLTSFYLYRTYKFKKSLFLFLIYLILIYFTQTRFVFVIIFSFFFFYIYLIFLNKISNTNFKVFIYLFNFTFISIFILFIINIFLTDSQSINEFATGRLFVWNLFMKESFNEIFYSIFGFGNSYISDLILEKYSKYFFYLKILDELSLHSSYLKLIEVCGILGLFIFIYLNIIALRNSDLFSKSVLLSFLVGGLVESFLMNPNTVASMFYWFILLLNLKGKDT